NARCQVKGWMVGKRIESHIEFKMSLLHSQPMGVDASNQRVRLIADVPKIIQRSVNLGQIYVRRIGALERAKMHGPLFDDSAIDLKREKITNHFEPWPSGARLGLTFSAW